MKEKTLEEKISYLKNNIITKDDSDSVDILNVINLISNTNLSDELMNQQDIIFSDLAEFSDIKTALKTDIENLKKEVSLHYLSVILSCRVVRTCNKDEIKDVPKYIKLLLVNLGFFNLNTILNKYISTIDIKDTFIVDDAISIMNQVLSPMYALDGVIKTLFVNKD